MEQSLNSNNVERTSNVINANEITETRNVIAENRSETDENTSEISESIGESTENIESTVQENQRLSVDESQKVYLEYLDTKLVIKDVIGYLCQNNMSQKELATKLNIDSRYFSSFLKSKPNWSNMKEPSQIRVQKLYEFLIREKTSKLSPNEISNVMVCFKKKLSASGRSLKSFAEEVLETNEQVLVDLMENKDAWSRINNLTNKEHLNKIYKFILTNCDEIIFNYQGGKLFMDYTKKKTAKHLLEALDKELSRANITKTDFSSYILNCNCGILSDLIKKKKKWKEYSSLQLKRLHAIFKWLDDENRIENFKISKEIALQKGRSRVNFIYFQETNNNDESSGEEFCDLNEYQKTQLEKVFKLNSDPDNEALEYLSEKLELSFGIIIKWFDAARKDTS